MRNWNEVNIGSTGFAQLGEDFYHEKQEIERDVLFEYFEKHHPVPEKFDYFTRFRWASNPHDFGVYHDLEIRYNEDVLEGFPEEEIDEFWDWANACECVDLECPEIMDKCKRLFAEKYPMQIVHKNNSDDENLRIVG